MRCSINTARPLATRSRRTSGGRIKAQLYPASQLGTIPRQIEGTQFGCDPMRDHSARVFCRHRRTFRSAGRAGSGHVGGAGREGRRRSAGAEVLSRARRQQGTAWRRRRLRRAVRGACQKTRSAISTISRARSCASLRRNSSRSRSVNWAPPRWRCRRATSWPRIQQGALDSAVAGVQLLSGLHFFDAAKYITLTNHAAIFYVVEISKKWYELAAARPATDRRPRRRLYRAQLQSAAERDRGRVDQGLDRRRRRIHQLAGRRTGGNDQDDVERRRRYLQEQAGRGRSLQDRERRGAARTNSADCSSPRQRGTRSFAAAFALASRFRGNERIYSNEPELSRR